MINFTSTVNFVVPAESVPTVVKLLLSNNISFSLASLNHSESKLNGIESTENQSANPIHDASNQLNKKSKILESIYQKYIKGDAEGSQHKESQIAAEFGISLTTFKVSFKAVYGSTFCQLYRQTKMEYAKKLLLQGINATKVSKRIGYSAPIKFNLMFRKHFGMTPKQYQTIHLIK